MTIDNHEPMLPNAQLPPEKPKNRWRKFLFAFLGFLALVATKYVLSFFAAETQVQMSKYDGWDAEFKASFVASCGEASKASILEQLTTLGKNEPGQNEKASSTYATSYCECMSTRIEQKNLIATKYNQLKGTDSYEQETSTIVETYMQTPEGKVDTQECSTLAETSSGVKISDEEYFVASCASSTVTEVIKQAKLDPKTMEQTRKVQIQRYAQEYCGCVGSGVYKAAKVALEKSDRRPTSDDDTSEFVDGYIDTPEGKMIMEQCSTLAESEMVK
ncbi:MAG: hypothetical protein A2X86_21205 [Bdellovibrionales bacterium GWA2_49_15]|nr:MAG: hypothetical protein A2X86_21205 [Bdellovibrionales bacterium GWA2_49_15]HAZ14897.1 hypothetical protein [Bdellovibrionales bacterium]